MIGSKKKNIINSQEQKKFQVNSNKKNLSSQYYKKSKEDLKLYKNIAIILNEDNNKSNKNKKRKDKDMFIYPFIKQKNNYQLIL